MINVVTVIMELSMLCDIGLKHLNVDAYYDISYVRLVVDFELLAGSLVWSLPLHYWNWFFELICTIVSGLNKHLIYVTGSSKVNDSL
jgi:hypothetical protein